MFKLRVYQAEAVECILRDWREGCKRLLLVLPTGAGKTVVFSKVIKERIRDGSRALVLAHRDELLAQASDKLGACGVETVLEKAEKTSLGSSVLVTVASVQSLANRLDKFPKDYFGTIVIDEAHHVLSPTYQKILEHFSGADVLGVTATPDRGDRKNLGQFFYKTSYEYSLKRAVSEGYLASIRAQMIPLKVDLSGVSVSAGDYSASGVGSALDPWLCSIAREMASRCRGRRTVAFLPLIETSKKLCEMLRASGLRAAEINGNSDDRAEVLRAFESGELDVLCNSMLLTEGWDCPSVDCIVVLRPTRSRALYQQMVGRGMRLCSGKDHLLLLDFLWLTERHDLCRPAGLIAPTAEIAEKMGERLASLEEKDLFEVERDVVGERERALRKQLEDNSKKKAKSVDPMQYGSIFGLEELFDYEPTCRWEELPPTEKQLDACARIGVDPKSVKYRGQAAKIIGHGSKRKWLATPRQVALLKSFKFARAEEFTKREAGEVISILADHGWRIPRGVNPETWLDEKRIFG